MTISESAQQIIEKRYLYKRNYERTWDDVAHRLGVGVGDEKYATMISDMLFVPGGRILRNIGRPRGSLFNCYNIPIGDSREEIGDCFKHCLMLWGEGGGCGINFSTLRPEGAAIKGVGGTSSGLVSFMQALDGIAATVESGGQRRAASLGLCEVSHPEIEKFIRSKLVEGAISYFNISVGITEDFIQAVQEDEWWTLHFNGKPYKKVDARTLWAEILAGMQKNGEPGLINMDNLRSNNSWYYSPVTGVNPCGEATLEDYGVCNLGSIVLPKFVANGRVKWSLMENTIHDAVEFLDACIDINRFVLPQIRQVAQRGRRIGLGVMGYADMLFDLGLRYGERDALDFTERLFKFIRNCAYAASMKLASEKGTFPAFNNNMYCKSHFIRSLAPQMRKDIRQYGIRNVTLLAMAPTGTISLIPETTSGIEPLYAKAYKREDRIGERIYIHPRFKAILEHTGDEPLDESYLVDSSQLQPNHHIDTQVAIQKYVDGAVSKTLNVPSTFSDDNLSSLLLESVLDVKGFTLYREGSREIQILTPIDRIEAMRALADADTSADAETVECSEGSCNI